MTNAYVLEVNSSAIVCKVGVNGAPIAVDDHAVGQYMRISVNEWLMPPNQDEDIERKNPTNQITVFIQWPKGKEFKLGEASVDAKIILDTPVGADPVPPSIVAGFKWPIPGLPERYPFATNIPFRIKSAPGTKLFSEAETLQELSDSDKRDILEVVEQFRSLLIPMKSPEAAYDFAKYKFEDRALASGKDIAKLRKTAVLQYGVFRQMDAPISSKLDPSRAVFTLIAGNKVVMVTDGSGDEAIVLRETAGEKGLYAVDVFVSKIGGKWRIVR